MLFSCVVCFLFCYVWKFIVYVCFILEYEAITYITDLGKVLSRHLDRRLNRCCRRKNNFCFIVNGWLLCELLFSIFVYKGSFYFVQGR